ncbi:hypothetical protein BD410DRAFT_782250 [Rickenella mellea]|uniref:Uncharacterized protein n=1 Tax=Rickenella mellea TaxID=50990 RepID=A0A4Y7QMY6_9AGAM|nr:hypothetical protein BD410DRAFT_782250 [Rickenella mellea]
MTNTIDLKSSSVCNGGRRKLNGDAKRKSNSPKSEKQPNAQWKKDKRLPEEHRRTSVHCECKNPSKMWGYNCPSYADRELNAWVIHSPPNPAVPRLAVGEASPINLNLTELCCDGISSSRARPTVCVQIHNRKKTTPTVSPDSDLCHHSAK